MPGKLNSFIPKSINDIGTDDLDSIVNKLCNKIKKFQRLYGITALQPIDDYITNYATQGAAGSISQHLPTHTSIPATFTKNPNSFTGQIKQKSRELLQEHLVAETSKGDVSQPSVPDGFQVPEEFAAELDKMKF